MTVTQPPGGSYDQIAIPIYTDEESARQQRREDPRLKEVGYLIEHRVCYAGNSGRPYALTEITQRYQGGMPYHFYTGRYYEHLEEALGTAQLAEWHRRRADGQAAECVLEGSIACDLQAREAYRLLQGTKIADPPSVLAYYGKLCEENMQSFRQVGARFAALREQGRDWRDAWAATLPPDPLGLIQWSFCSPYPLMIDWVATVERVAATVAVSHDDGSRWSHEHAISLLLARQQIACHWYLLRAALRRFVEGSRGRVVFGPDWQKRGRPDYSMVCWREAEPSVYSVRVPTCTYCGRGRQLNNSCPGYWYGSVADDTYVSSPCLFDGYGCVPPPPEVKSWALDCCHCRAVARMREAGASIGEIEEEIALRLRQFRAAGGSPLRLASWIVGDAGNVERNG